MERATKKEYNPCLGCYYGCEYELDKSKTPCDTVIGYNRAVALEDILGDDYDLDRLRELVEADREGRCFFAPVKPGNIVTCIWYGMPTQAEVKSINFYWVGNEVDWYATTADTTGGKECFGKKDWRETVFLTRESAEAALKGEQDGVH